MKPIEAQKNLTQADSGAIKLSKSLLLPGPKGWPLVGSLPNFLFNRIPFFERLVQDYAGQKIIPFQLGSKQAYLLNDLDLIKELLVSIPKAFHRHGPLKRLIGDGVLTSENQEHRHQRGHLNHAFTQERIEKYSPLFTPLTLRLAQRWENNQVLDFEKEMNQLSLSIITQVLFGEDLDEKAKEVADSLRTMLPHFNFYLLPFSEFLEKLPLPNVVRFSKARAIVNAYVFKKIQEGPKLSDSLLSFLLTLKDKKGGRAFSDQEVRNQVMTLFFAGQETIATSLTWAFHSLASAPEIQDKLMLEIDTLLQEKLPAFGDLHSLNYTRMFFSETLRLYPPLWMIARSPVEDISLGGYLIKKNSMVAYSQFLIHRDPRFYENPECFDPMRWTDEEKAKRPVLAYLPFSIGPRFCIGEQFAWAEGMMAIATLLQKFRFEALSTEFPGFSAGLTLRPKKKILLRVTARKPKAVTTSSIPSETVEALVQAAALSPSGDNCQPWRFQWDGSELLVFQDDSKAQHALNRANHASLLSLGCVVEAVIIAANEQGYKTAFNWDEKSLREKPAVFFKFEKAQERDKESLFPALSLRVVDRRPYRRGSLQTQFFKDIKQEALRFEPCELYFMKQIPNDLKSYLLSAEGFVWEHRNAQQDLFKWIRFSNHDITKTCDGMSWRNLAMTFLESRIAILCKNFSFQAFLNHRAFLKQARAVLAKNLKSSAGLGLITVKDLKPETILEAGRLWMRTWLHLNLNSYGLQPLTSGVFPLYDKATGVMTPSLPFYEGLFSSGLPIFQKTFDLSDGEIPVMLFRTGKTTKLPTAMRTLRKPLNQIYQEVKSHEPSTLKRD